MRTPDTSAGREPRGCYREFIYTHLEFPDKILARLPAQQPAQLSTSVFLHVISDGAQCLRLLLLLSGVKCMKWSEGQMEPYQTVHWGKKRKKKKKIFSSNEDRFNPPKRIKSSGDFSPTHSLSQSPSPLAPLVPHSHVCTGSTEKFIDIIWPEQLHLL